MQVWSLGIFDLVGVIMLVLAGTSYIYLLRVKNKSSSTEMLLWFFLCVTLSSIATIVTNIGTAWDWAIAPSQDAALILGGVFLVRFAYLFPTNDQPKEARWVVTLFFVSALIALTYAGNFAIRYIINIPGDLKENQYFYLLLPLTIGLTIFVFFRRSIHCSVKELAAIKTDAQRHPSSVRFLFKPRNRAAHGLRNYGISLAISLVPAVVLIEKTALPAVVASFLFNFGAVMAIAALMLTYFNYTPESVTISAKLVGISLVSVLLILGFAGVWIYHNNPGVDEQSLFSTFILLVILSSLLIILIFPFFFNTALLDPLGRLLKGVKTANEGDLSIQVPVQYVDEIGYLTQSFNSMIRSLNHATQALKNETEILETQVALRTAELSKSNDKLISENAVRKVTQAKVDRQLRYEQALAGCSQSLLITADDEGSQRIVLAKAMEYLLSAAQASRAYILRNFEHSELGLCTGLLAEVCAPGIFPLIDNPVNQLFPLSRFPPEMVNALAEGKPYGGPVKQALLNSPYIRDIFLSQKNPLLSFICFPITDRGHWWGFVGFDDCVTEREWDEMEVSILRTTSEMIGNTLQRWEVEKHLRETLENLEQRVYERTLELTQVNADLRYEIHERQRFQDELEERLETERAMADISVRLLSPIELKEAVMETLTALGAIMKASHVIFIQLHNSSIDTLDEIIEWHSPLALPLSDDLERCINDVNSRLNSFLDKQKAIYIDAPSIQPDGNQVEIELLAEMHADAVLLTPLIQENRLTGVIACCNPELAKSKILENTQLAGVVASLLDSHLRRETLLNTLEVKVAERTRELSAFFDLAVLAGEAQELSDIMQPALTKIMEISASEAAVIHVFDEEQRVMNIVAQRGFQSRYLSQLQTIHLDKQTMDWIIGRSHDAWSSGPSKHPESFDLAEFQSDAHIPLRARGKIQGLLSCYRLSPVPFNPYQVFFLNAVGEQLGLAVENYRLRQRTEEIATIHERQRLARELHDAVSQSLFSLTLFARSGRDAYQAGEEAKLVDSLEQIEASSLAALREMRLLLYQLRALALEEGHLSQAIEARYDLVERRLGIDAVIQMDDNIQLNAQVEQELFRLVTEALNNALKHSGASQVSVQIRIEDEQLTMQIWDNGVGFDPELATSGMGLQNMRERATALKGQFDVTSQPGNGTLIRVSLPYTFAPIHEA